MKLAYYFSAFPHLSMTFCQREVKALMGSGIDLYLIANRPPRPDQVHPGDRGLFEQTVYLTRLPWRAYAAANLKQAFTAPSAWVRAFFLAWRLGEGDLKQSLRNLGRAAGAAVLARMLKARGVGHVHVHFAFGAAGLAVLLKAMTGLPYSLTIHGSDALLPQPYIRDKLKRADFIVSVCQYHIDHLPRRFPELARQKFHLVRLGLDLSEPRWAPKPLDFTGGALRILHVGRLDEVKAQEVLIEACGRLRDAGIEFICHLVGDGPRKSFLKGRVESLGLTERVRLDGPSYEDQTAAWFDWCHVFALSSRSEGTPMTIMEASAKARPSVVPRITALPEMVVDGESGFLFEPLSPDDLAERLARLAYDPALLHDMSAAARRVAEEKFDLNQNIRRLIDVFQSEINPQGA